MPRILILALALTACRDGSPQSSPANGNDLGPSLVGAWDARLTLSKPYPLGLNERTTQIICGTIAFGENRHYAVASKDDTWTDPGVYDLDLSSLGLAWIDDPPYPIAVAKLSQAHNSGSSFDSVAIVLNPGSVERIVLLGHYDASRIDGRWTAQSARGTAAGSFSLTPHASERAICDRPVR